jgi:hypothetical protein
MFRNFALIGMWVLFECMLLVLWPLVCSGFLLRYDLVAHDIVKLYLVMLLTMNSNFVT